MTAPVATTKHKSWIALVGGLLSVAVPILIDLAVYLPPQWSAAISAAIALATAFGVYKVPNKPVDAGPVVTPDFPPAPGTPHIPPPTPPPYQPSQPPPGGWTNPWK